MLFIFALALLVFVGHTSMSSHANDNNDNATPSPDFNGNGVVDIPDFLMFVESFGLRQSDAEATHIVESTDTISMKQPAAGERSPWMGCHSFNAVLAQRGRCRVRSERPHRPSWITGMSDHLEREPIKNEKTGHQPSLINC